MLTPPQLSQLRLAFLQSQGLTKTEFVSALLTVLGRHEPDQAGSEDTLRMTATLVDAFEAVDINHDGTIDWEEFSVFYIANGASRGPPMSRLKHRLQERSTFETHTPHTTAVTRLRFIPELHKLFVCEAGCHTLKVHEAAVLKVADGMPLLGEISLGAADALDVVFVEEHRLLVVACTDFTLKLFDSSQLMPSPRRFKGIMASVYKKLRSMQGSGSGAVSLSATAGEDELMEALASQAAAEDARLRRRRMAAGAAVKDFLPLDLIGTVHAPTVQRTLSWQAAGQQVISAGLDERILVWAVRQGDRLGRTGRVVLKQAGVLLGHTSTVNDVLVIPESGCAPGRASAGPNGEVPVGHALPEAEDDALTAPADRTKAGGKPSAEAADGMPAEAMHFGHLVSVSSDHTVRIWRYADDKITPVRVCREHDQSVQVVRYVRLPRMILTAGLDWFIQAYDLAVDEGSPLMRLNGHTAPVVGLAAIPSRSQAVSVDELGFVRWWNVCRDASVLDDGRCLQVMRPACANVSPYVPLSAEVVHSLPAMAARAMGAGWEGLTLVRVGHALAAGGMAAGAQLTEQLDALRATSEDHGSRASASAGTKAGRPAAAPKPERTSSQAANWDVSTKSSASGTADGGRSASREGGGSKAVAEAARRAAFPHGCVILAGSRLKCFESAPVTDEASVPVAVEPATELGCIIAVLERDIRVMAAGSGNLIRYFEEAAGGTISCAARTPESRVLFVGLSGGGVRSLNLGTGATVHELPGHAREVSAVIPCAEDALVFTAGWDSTIRVVDQLLATPGSVTNKQLEDDLSSTSGKVGRRRRPPRPTPADAPDAKPSEVAGCARDGSHSVNFLRVRASIDRPEGMHASVLREVRSAMPGAITCAARSAELGLLATGDAEGNLRLWLYESLTPAGRALGHTAQVSALRFVSNTSTLVSADASGRVFLWRTLSRQSKGSDLLECAAVFRARLAPGPKPTPLHPRPAVGGANDAKPPGAASRSARTPGLPLWSVRGLAAETPHFDDDGALDATTAATADLDPSDGVSALAAFQREGRVVVMAGTDAGAIGVWDATDVVLPSCALTDDVVLGPSQPSYEPRRRTFASVHDDPDAGSAKWQTHEEGRRMLATVRESLEDASLHASNTVRTLLFWTGHPSGPVTVLRVQNCPAPCLVSGGGRGEVRAWDLSMLDEALRGARGTGSPTVSLKVAPAPPDGTAAAEVSGWPWLNLPEERRPRVADFDRPASLPAWGVILTTPNAPPEPLPGQWRFPTTDDEFLASRARHARRILHDVLRTDAQNQFAAQNDESDSPRAPSGIAIALRRAQMHRQDQRRQLMQNLARMLGLDQVMAAGSASNAKLVGEVASRADPGIRAAELCVKLPTTPRRRFLQRQADSAATSSSPRSAQSTLEASSVPPGADFEASTSGSQLARRGMVLETMLRGGRPAGDNAPSAAMALAASGGTRMGTSDGDEQGDAWWSDDRMRRALLKRQVTADDAQDPFTTSNLRRLLKQELTDSRAGASQLLPASRVMGATENLEAHKKASMLAGAIRRTLNVTSAELEMASVPGWEDREGGTSGKQSRYPAMAVERNRRNAAARSAAAHVLMKMASEDVQSEILNAAPGETASSLREDVILEMTTAPSEFLASRTREADGSFVRRRRLRRDAEMQRHVRRIEQESSRVAGLIDQAKRRGLHRARADVPVKASLPKVTRAPVPDQVPGPLLSPVRSKRVPEAQELVDLGISIARSSAGKVRQRRLRGRPSFRQRANSDVFGMRIEKHRAMSVQDTHEIAAHAVLQEEFKQSLARDAARRKARTDRLARVLSAPATAVPAAGGAGAAAPSAVAAEPAASSASNFGVKAISQRSGVRALRKALIDVTTDLGDDNLAARLEHQRRARARLRQLDPLEAMFAPGGPGPGPDAPPGHVLAMRRSFGPYKRNDVAGFRSVIQRVDKDGDGVVSRIEFLADPFVTNDEELGTRMESVYRSLDRDGTGNVTIAQFARAMFSLADAPTIRDILAFTLWRPVTKEDHDVMRRKYSARTVADLRRLFRLYDADGGGTISRDELLDALRSLNGSGKQRATRNIYESAASVETRLQGLAIIEEQLTQIMARVDLDGNEELDFEEFVALMGPTFEPTAPIVPDLDGRFRPKLVPEDADLLEEEDPLEEAARLARQRRIAPDAAGTGWGSKANRGRRAASDDVEWDEEL